MCGWSHDLRTLPRKCPKCHYESKRRVERIKKEVDRIQRSIKWIQSLSVPEDKGLGDTIARIKTDKPTDLNKIMTRLLASRSCRYKDAVEQLNQRYPYARNIVQSDSSGSST